MKGTIRLTTFSKILILILILGLLGGGIYAGVSKGIIKKGEDTKTSNVVVNDKSTSKSTPTVDSVDGDGNVINTAKTTSDTINLSLDELYDVHKKNTDC